MIREGANREEYNTGLYWRYEKWIRRNLNRIDAMLGATGSIYAIRRELAPQIPPEILLDDVYVPFAAAFRGSRIYFEDEAKAYDLPTALQAEFWRKVRTQAGVYQILFHFPALLSPFNRRFVHFLSHKMGRLLLPFALLAAAFKLLPAGSLARGGAAHREFFTAGAGRSADSRAQPHKTIVGDDTSLRRFDRSGSVRVGGVRLAGTAIVEGDASEPVSAIGYDMDALQFSRDYRPSCSVRSIQWT